MKFKKYLNELFDTNIKIDYQNKSLDFYDFDFTVNDKVYNVNIFKNHLDIQDNKKGVWEIMFFDKEGEETITGQGGKDVFKIFAGVIKCIKIVVNKEHPEKLMFSAKEPSRKNLYNKFAKLIEKSTDYKQVINDPNFNKFSHYEKEYVFKKK